MTFTETIFKKLGHVLCRKIKDVMEMTLPLYKEYLDDISFVLTDETDLLSEIIELALCDDEWLEFLFKQREWLYWRIIEEYNKQLKKDQCVRVPIIPKIKPFDPLFN